MRQSQAQTKLARLLALAPYLVANPGVSPQDVCRAFTIDRATLDGDLDVLWMCGLPPYDPYALIDVERDEDHITVSSADYFARPLSLTVAEARALVSALAILGDVGDEGSALRRLIDKVSSALGDLAPSEPIRFAKDEAGRPSVFNLLKEAIDRSLTAQITYYSASRDTTGRRCVDPHRLVNVGGHWYVAAYCHDAGEARLFRLDRIEDAALTDDSFDPADLPDLPSYEDGVLYRPSTSDKVARVRFGPNVARWAAEVWAEYDAKREEDRSVTVGIPYAQATWLIKQLLPYGPEARILEPPELIDSFAETVSRLALRYQT